MDIKVEKVEKSKVKIIFTVDKEEFAERLEKTFKKNAKKFNIPGFRPGKAPRSIIEKTYGAESLNYMTVEEFVDEDFKKAVEENSLKLVGTPALDVEKASREEGAIYFVLSDVEPEVEVKNYKGLEVEFKAKQVTKKDIDARIEKARENNARTVTIEDKPVENGNVANIDFEGFKDGVAFEGGKGEKYDLTIGSNTFIPGFEEAVIGMKVGEEKEINVTFPKDYGMAELAGSPVVFKVKVNSISSKILPELDDEFAKDVSEFETLKEYKEKVKADVQKEIEAENKVAKENKVFDKLLEENPIEVPESMIDAQVDNLMKQTEQELSYQGLNIETYCKYFGMEEATMKANFRVQAEKDVKLQLLLEKIEEAEKIEVSEEEIEAELMRMLENYGSKDEKETENFKKNESIKNYISNKVKREKLINVIVDSSIVK